MKKGRLLLSMFALLAAGMTSSAQVAVVNGDFSTSGGSGWTLVSGSFKDWGGGQRLDGNAEFCQTISGVAPGWYKVSVNGYWRSFSNTDGGEIQAKYESYKAGEEGAAYGFFYGNDTEKALVSYLSSTLESAPSVTDANFMELTYGGNSVFIPINGVAHTALFETPSAYYLNELICVVGDDGKLTIGVKRTGDYRVFVDNFAVVAVECPTEVAQALLDEADAVDGNSKMDAPVQSALTTAINNFKADASYTNYKALEQAVKDANTSIIANTLKPGDEVPVPNGDFAATSAWTLVSGSWKPWGSGQRFDANFEFKQTLKELPEGWYRVTTQAYARTVNSAGNDDLQQELFDAYLAGADDCQSFFYGNDTEKKIYNWNAGTLAAEAGGSYVKVNDGDQDWYLPSDGNSHTATFANPGYYRNELLCYVGADGNLTIGLKQKGGYRTYCKNFKVTYIGTEAPLSKAAIALEDNGYATFVAPFDVVLPSGVEAFTVEGVDVDGQTLVLKSVGATVAANTPVVLHSASAVYAPVYGIDKATGIFVEKGLLTGVYEDRALAGGYVLQDQGDGPKFYAVSKANKVTVPATHAFLTVPGGSSVKAFGFSDIVTAIDGLSAARQSTGADIYNLQGQRLGSLQKGINVVGGKKVLVK